MQHSGWFSPNASLVVTYGIETVFRIANALNNPFGIDVQDIRLNRVLSNNVSSIFPFRANIDVSLFRLIEPRLDTPSWLEQPPEDEEHEELTNCALPFHGRSVRSAAHFS